MWDWVKEFLPWPSNWRERMAKGKQKAVHKLYCFDSPEQFFEAHQRLHGEFTRKCQELADLRKAKL